MEAELELTLDIDGRFHPKQLTATHAADTHKFTLFGGSRGPGKSYWLRWYLLRFLLICAAEPNNLTGVVAGLFCEDYPSLTKRQVSKISTEFPRELGEVKSSKLYGLGFHLREEYGAGVIALCNLDDPSKYQSDEFACIAVDELTKNPEGYFDLLRGSLRWPGIKNTRFIAASNPGGIGHLWVRNYWGIQQPQVLPERKKPLAEQFCFVPALPDDNPSLDEAYWTENLDTLDEDLYKAWRLGDWTSFEGQVFKDWRYAEHVIPPVIPPAHWKRLHGLDWGYSAPMSKLWGAQDPDTGRVIIYRELYQWGLTDREQARKIKEMSLPDEHGPIHADPSMWTKKNFEDRTFSTADEYRAEGVVLTPADNDRMSGKRKVATMLHERAPDGKPLLQITENCTNLVRTLPALPYDKTNVEDVDTKADDHSYDSCRYLLTPINPRPKRRPEEYSPEVLAAMKDPLLQRLNLKRTEGMNSKDL
jgi:phage terminase large subunit